MPRIRAVIAALAFACASSAACAAGDFMPRATNGFAAVGDDPGLHSASVDVGSAAPMSEETPGPARASASPRGGHVGVDGGSADNHAAATAPASDSDDKASSAAPANPHKSRALRWQSLLPGVMK